MSLIVDFLLKIKTSNRLFVNLSKNNNFEKTFYYEINDCR
jgi:hypothetical protein